MNAINPQGLKNSVLTKEDVVTLKRLKGVLVKSQLYEEAAHLRDLEKRIYEILEVQEKLGVPTVEALNRYKQELKTQLYTHDELMNLIDLATFPLKSSLEHYEKSVRTLIDTYLSKLLKENDILRNALKEKEEKEIKPEEPSSHWVPAEGVKTVIIGNVEIPLGSIVDKPTTDEGEVST